MMFTIFLLDIVHENCFIDVVIAHEAPFQEDGYSCGVYVATTMLQLAANRPIRFKDDKARRRREEMFASIMRQVNHIDICTFSNCQYWLKTYR